MSQFEHGRSGVNSGSISAHSLSIMAMSKQTSNVRQDDAVDMRPKNTFKPLYQQNTFAQQQ